MGPRYQHKIKTVAELRQAIGPRPRARSVIMCHGAFDIVHPGHLRHLMYAKGKADLLIASLTADEHILKADHRPYVPQELRAANLAALEMVDYVIIDANPTPIENVRALQPDYFAKGYEYFAEGIPPHTQEEIDTLDEYGGEMVFTPGDIVYSSSRLIEAHAPRIPVEKLLALMESEGVDFADLRKVLRGLAGLRVHVLGDTIIDAYSHCALLGGAPKSPTFSVRLERSDLFTGGAGGVARHVKAAGATVSFSTVLGEDELKAFALRELDTSGVDCRPIVDRTRPTTRKERFITDGYKMLQVDRVDNRPISERITRTLCDALRDTPADVVVCSDFRHGIFNRQTKSRSARVAEEHYNLGNDIYNAMLDSRMQYTCGYSSPNLFIRWITRAFCCRISGAISTAVSGWERRQDLFRIEDMRDTATLICMAAMSCRLPPQLGRSLPRQTAKYTEETYAGRSHSEVCRWA